MIPTLIFLLIRYYKGNTAGGESKLAMFSKAGKVFLLMLLFTAIAPHVLSQEKRLIYQIKKNGSVIGNMGLTQHATGDKVIVRLHSKVETKFIFKAFCATSKEETIFEKGLITYSSIYRNLNGSEKENKKLTIGSDNYRIEKQNKSQILNFYPIRHNMLSLYFSEPVHFKQVYSDNHQQFLDIKKLSSHTYQINFPDGNYSQYSYTDGICQKINVHNNFYNVEIELQNAL
jgi:hypothetical protein